MTMSEVKVIGAAVHGGSTNEKVTTAVASKSNGTDKDQSGSRTNPPKFPDQDVCTQSLRTLSRYFAGLEYGYLVL